MSENTFIVLCVTAAAYVVWYWLVPSALRVIYLHRNFGHIEKLGHGILELGLTEDGPRIRARMALKNLPLYNIMWTSYDFIRDVKSYLEDMAA